MAGNTKFIGFLPGNRIQLERWGSSVEVSLNEQSIEELRVAVQRDLPQKPYQGRAGHLADLGVEYDKSVGRAVANMDIATAAYLADLLEVLVTRDLQAVDKVSPWVAGLRAAVKAHADFHNTQEPGVENEKRSP
jgi:hypothetical protein